MDRRIAVSLMVLAGACASSTRSDSDHASAEARVQCFEHRSESTSPACPSATTRVEGCFVEGGVEIDYRFEPGACEGEAIDHDRDHGALAWQGRLGPAWATTLEHLAAWPLDSQGEGLTLRSADGHERSGAPSTKRDEWQAIVAELDEIAAEAAGLGAPAPIVVIARQTDEERFELRRHPLERSAELSWRDHAGAGHCTIDEPAMRAILDALAGSRPLDGSRQAESLPSCPDLPGYFMPSFAPRSSEPHACSAWTGAELIEGDELLVVDPSLGEVRWSIANALVVLRRTASACSGESTAIASRR
ncbi:hypothetical protein ACNOYE_30595 [Nannocystaceae bacterium ST9]